MVASSFTVRSLARGLLSVAAVILLSISSATSLMAQDVLRQLQDEYKAVYKATKASVVAVAPAPLERLPRSSTMQAGPSAAKGGAGWVYRDQYVVTSVENAFSSAHSVSRSRDLNLAMKELKLYYVITPEGESLECAVVGFDMASLSMVLRLPRNAKFPSLKAVSDRPVIGQTVAALGNSFDSILADGQVSYSVGSLSDAYRMEPIGLEGNNDDPGDPYRGTMLEFEGAGNPGDYGGPLVDMNGRVIGMICGHYHSGRRLACAVPSGHLVPAIDAIIDGKPKSQVMLGLYISKAGRDDVAREGIILSVTEGSNAERAGLQRGDEIVLIDGWRMNGFDQISRAFGSRYATVGSGSSLSVSSYGMPEGASVLVTVRRDGKLITKEIIAGEQSAMPRNVDGSVSGNRPRGADTQGAMAANASSKHLVKVITDWRRSARSLPQASGQGILGLGGGPDPVFLDTTIGPYTGVIIDADGGILVSDQVFGEFIEGRPAGISARLRQVYVVLSDGSTHEAVISARNQESGLAMLKINAKGLSPITFSTTSPKAAESLTLVSRSNHHVMYSIRAGIVSAVDRDGGNGFQFDARIGSCDLGSLVLAADGSPIGIVVNLPTAEVGKASGVAVASYGAKSLNKSLESLRNGEFKTIPPHPFLGVGANPAYSDQPGLKVGSVVARSGAAEAGITEGDVIVEIDDKEMRKTSDLVEIIRSKKVGDTITLKIDRNGEEMIVTATLKARP